jgi:hypothetical protein
MDIWDMAESNGCLFQTLIDSGISSIVDEFDSMVVLDRVLLGASSYSYVQRILTEAAPACMQQFQNSESNSSSSYVQTIETDASREEDIDGISTGVTSATDGG